MKMKIVLKKPKKLKPNWYKVRAYIEVDSVIPLPRRIRNLLSKKYPIVWADLPIWNGSYHNAEYFETEPRGIWWIGRKGGGWLGKMRKLIREIKQYLKPEIVAEFEREFNLLFKLEEEAKFSRKIYGDNNEKELYGGD